LIVSQLLLRCSSPCVTSALTSDLPISLRSKHGGSGRATIAISCSGIIDT
jgi:hypothetical protein